MEEPGVSVPAPKRLTALTLGAAFVIAACTGGASPSPSTAPSTAPSGAPSGAASPSAASATGSINVSGSSTVEPISTAVAQLFKQANPDWNYTIEGPGTGDGFKRFCAGETDISDASRAIKPEGEADVCAQNGIEYIELKIAYDGMAVMTSVDNSAVTCLSFADIYSLVGPESTGFKKWSDGTAIAKELGSNTVLPDAELVITGPGEESGTYDSFVEIVLDGIAKGRGQIPEGKSHTATRPDYTSSANDNVIIEGITGNPASFGWVGLAFAEENKDKVKEIEVSKDPNGTCVKPSATTVSDGTYPISRPLFIYVNKAKAQENPAIVPYVDFYLADGTISKVLETVPYVNLPADELAATVSTWGSSKP
jgi:phosphate transport system substrate-binding protein